MSKPIEDSVRMHLGMDLCMDMSAQRCMETSFALIRLLEELRQLGSTLKPWSLRDAVAGNET